MTCLVLGSLGFVTEWDMTVGNVFKMHTQRYIHKVMFTSVCGVTPRLLGDGESLNKRGCAHLAETLVKEISSNS